MKTLVEVKETENEGLLALMGQNIIVFGTQYYYAGKLVGVNATCIKLTNACKVYETGPLVGKSWKTSEALPNDTYVMLHAIEAFTVSGR